MNEPLVQYALIFWLIATGFASCRIADSLESDCGPIQVLPDKEAQ